MARPRTAILTPEIIGRAAIDLVERGHDLQMKPLAEKLGVRVSSLYHHVEGRAGVIHAMRQVLAARYPFEVNPDGTWQEVIRRALRSAWRMYADHPRVLQLMVTVVIDEPDVLALYEVLVTALRRAGIPESDLLTTVETLDAFIFGAALDRLSPDRIIKPETPDLMGLLDAHPVGNERNERLFEQGITLIIAGIEARAGDAAAAGPIPGSEPDLLDSSA